MENSHLVEISALLLLGLVLGCHYLLYRRQARSRLARRIQQATLVRSLTAALLAPLALVFNFNPGNPLPGLLLTQLLLYSCLSCAIEAVWVYLQDHPDSQPPRRDWRNSVRLALALTLTGDLILKDPSHLELFIALIASTLVLLAGLSIHKRLFYKVKPQRAWLRELQSKLSGHGLLLVCSLSFFYLLKGWAIIPITSGQMQLVRELLALTVALVLTESCAASLDYFLRLRHRSAEVAHLAADGLRALAYLALSLLALSHWTHQDLGALALSSAFFSLGLGLALKPTLGNLVAGLALRLNRDFEIGDFLQVGDLYGRVTHINWRSIDITTLENDIVALPHSRVARSTLINSSLPSPQHACYLEILLPLQHPPGVVRQRVLEALERIPEVAQFPPSEIYLMDLRARGCSYRIRWWLEDIVDRRLFESEVRSKLLYALQRHDLHPLLPQRQWIDSVAQTDPESPTGEDGI